MYQVRWQKKLQSKLYRIIEHSHFFAKQGGFEAADEGTSGLHGHPAAHPGDRQCADTAYRSPQQGQENKKGEGGHLLYCRRTVHPADGTGAADGDGGDTPKPAAVRNFCIKQNKV